MGIGVSIFLIAVGAILTFAIHASISGVSLATVGVILMIVGALGLATFLLVFAPRRRTYAATTADYPVGGGPVGPGRVEERTVREQY